jgi:hypothetical protein
MRRTWILLTIVLTMSCFAGARSLAQMTASRMAATRAASNTRVPLDYPLALKTRWIYHIHKELGSGVHFDEEDGALAKGNTLDITVVSEVAGSDVIGGAGFARVETRRDGKPYMYEWFRIGPEGLLLGKTTDWNSRGGPVVMVPPQKVLSPDLRPGDSWAWKASDQPVSIRTRIVGPMTVSVPAGSFRAIETMIDITMQTPDGPVVHGQGRRYFMDGIGFVKQDIRMHVENRFITQIVTTLERFEPSPGSR